MGKDHNETNIRNINMEELLKEKAEIIEKIRHKEAERDKATNDIYWLKKRGQLLEKQIKSTPVERPVSDGEVLGEIAEGLK